ncbi:MAG: hypothetical protein U1D99_11005 [Candidatus Omnitrophota bacterium]|nr:hypothetical protein [Candidatus Omnitrophota bacterium]
MNVDGWIEKIGFVAAVVLPLWNIPLVWRIVKRRSSQDISLAWAVGVWICIILMFPAGLKSPDATWRVFNIMNTVLFTTVVLATLRFRKGPGPVAP